MIEPDSKVPFLSGGGEMGARMRAMDWSATPLGPVHQWPQSLKTAVRIMLTSRQAMFVWWGDELVNLYNDAYRAIVGGKHPEALGQPAAVVWREIWDQVGPRAESAIRRNEGTYDEALRLIMERNGYPEETYYTFSYSPVPDDEGGTGGILCANTEETRRILGERQLGLLRELAARTVDTRTFEDACTRSAACLAANALDLPFAMIYLVDPERNRVSLAGRSGFVDCDPELCPDLADLDTPGFWPFAEVARSHQTCQVDLAAAVDRLPCGAWDRPPLQAMALPILSPGQSGQAGILIAGLNPYRLLDDGYRGFLELIAAQIAASLGSAQAYEEERRRSEALAELDRAKTAFFSNVSHEFRTPLTLMLGPLDDLLSGAEAGDLAPEKHELLTLVRRNGQRLLKLVNTLLDFSRIEAGRVQAVYEPVDLAAATVELASVFRSAVERAGMRLVIDCPPLPEPVYVDRDMWEKIVLNLVSNAFKYTLDGEIRVTLRAAGDAAVLTVQDTGIGIPAAEVPRLFNRFHRVEGARGRTQEGSGIGLALVQELARLHGGTVGVESAEGEGSTFTVTLPFGRAHLPAGRIGRPAELASTALGAAPFVEEALRWLPDADLSRPDDSAAFPVLSELPVPASGAAPAARIVLADDNADMRSYVRRLLASRYEVIDAADGQQALHAAVRHRPDLVLSDVMMPNLDGFGLLKALRDDPRTASVPVILLSARAGEEARVEGLQAGADDYLIKPFSARELLARVSGLLALDRVRREALHREEELKAETVNILESIAEGFVALDRDFRFTYMNAEAERLNHIRREDLIGKSHWELYPATIGTPLEEGYRRAMNERVPVRFENFYEPWQRWFEIDVYPTRDGGIGVYYRDITERKAAMAALQEADRRKDEFLATLAHELRNPLAPLRNGLQILRMAPQGDAAGRALGMMERQLQQMVRLIDDLLDVSRISLGKIELRKERIDLAGVVRSALETGRPVIERAGHEIEVELPIEPVYVEADAVRLAQVFANLLNNAAKFTERGGHIRIAVKPQGEQVAVSVRDDGIGISAAMLPRVFDIFTQGDRSLERTQAGLGIGLTIVKRLVEMHGGTVEARSEGPGRGSEMTVRLPVAAPEVPVGLGAGAGTAGRGAARRVLVVDDNVDAAISLAMMLEILGHQIRTAHDGLGALEVGAELRPGVILLDIGMPGLNGYETCRLIRETEWGRDAYLVALTGWGQEEDRRRSAEAGFDHHLVKPVEPEVLQKLLGEAGGARL